jgi:hypothetical protein
MTVKLCPDGTRGAPVSCERTESALAAAHDLTCLGEILEAIGTNENVGGALVSWLGERVGKARVWCTRSSLDFHCRTSPVG